MSSQGDGRNIDVRAGLLEGEAADQKIGADRAVTEGSPEFAVYRKAAVETYGSRTYYDRPVIKEPVWLWFVPGYFFAGGAAGAAQVLGATAQSVDREGLRGLIKRCRWIATVSLVAGSAFLVADLGRPERFINMLRVFRPTSAMNMGSWILATSGPLAGASALLADAEGAFGSLGDLAGLAAGPAGLPLSAYTAVLISDTAVPIWQQTRRALPALFAASSMASATSLLQTMDLDEAEERIVKRLGLMSKGAELVAATAVDVAAGRVERVAKPLKEGVSGSLWTAAKALIASSLALSLFGRGKVAKRTGGVFGIAGSLAVRFALHHAGKASARDPKATFELQRSEPDG